MYRNYLYIQTKVIATDLIPCIPMSVRKGMMLPTD